MWFALAGKHRYKETDSIYNLYSSGPYPEGCEGGVFKGSGCIPLSPKRGVQWRICNPPPFFKNKLLGIIFYWKIEILAFKYFKRNWVFVTNSFFLIPISLEPNDVNLRYFKLILFDLTEVNVKGLRHWFLKI